MKERVGDGKLIIIISMTVSSINVKCAVLVVRNGNEEFHWNLGASDECNSDRQFSLHSAGKFPRMYVSLLFETQHADHAIDLRVEPFHRMTFQLQ